MRSSLVVRLVVVSSIRMLPVLAQAQEAAVSGTITDTSGAVLSAVIVRAVHEATGNAFETGPAAAAADLVAWSHVD